MHICTSACPSANGKRCSVSVSCSPAAALQLMEHINENGLYPTTERLLRTVWRTSDDREIQRRAAAVLKAHGAW